MPIQNCSRKFLLPLVKLKKYIDILGRKLFAFSYCSWGRNINNLRYADDATLMAESEEELKSLLMRVKEETEKAGLKLNIQKIKIIASGSITSWQIGGEKVEAAAGFIFLSSKVTVNGNCSHEMKRHLLLGKKSLKNLDSMLNSRDITLPTKVRVVKAMFFPVVMYGYESWTIKKAEHQLTNWCFQTVVLEKTPESLLDCREIQPVHPKGNQPWIFIGKTDAEAESPILLPPAVKSWLIGRDAGAGKDWGQEEKAATQDEMVGWHHQFCGCELGRLWGIVKDREAWLALVHEAAKSQTRCSHWVMNKVEY